MKWNNKGFMLSEIMVTLAVLVISFSIIGVNAAEIKKELNQSQADAYARQIYVSAQDNITRLYTSGQSSLMESKNELEYNPSTYTGTRNLRYITSTDKDIDAFCDAECEGTWVIEYDSVYGRVFGVYYSADTLDDYTKTEDDELYRFMTNQDKLDFADDHKYNISYYGAETMDATIPEPTPPPKMTIGQGFCYYEVYDDLSVGYYLFKTNFDSLQDKMVIGDGYGIVVGEKEDLYGISISGTKTFSMAASMPLEIEGGYIGRFPTEWMRANWLENSAITKSTPTNRSQYNQPYWWVVNVKYNGTIQDETWSYSPYYAKSALEGTGYSDLPSTVCIRSARQLNALSWMYPSYYNKKWAWNWTPTNVIKTTFVQELDINYSMYQFEMYTGRSCVGQLPIGTDWGRFISNYNGQGHTISNIKLLRRNTTGNEYSYAGLFGFVSLGTIQNVTVTKATIENADYAGILATYVQNATISNCSVSNSTITFKQTNTYNQTTGGNEFANARVGSLIGYIKCPEENNSKYYTMIDSCKVNNCTITAPDYMQTTAYYRQYQIGGFVGAVANFETNQSRANHITIKNCSVNATIKTKSYGKGSNYCYIGTFAGAIKKYVNVSGISANTTMNTKNYYSDYYSS